MRDYRSAVLKAWQLRAAAAAKARARGSRDGSLRQGVTSGKHLDPLAKLVADEFVRAGLPSSSVFRTRHTQVPGYFRAEKKWDVVVVHEGELVAAVELKSILGSYGNNLNNRAEEAVGNAVDLIKAGQNSLLGDVPPWLGYVFLMQDEDASRAVVRTSEPHFSIDSDFRGSSYQHRAGILLRRLLQERLYNAAWLVTGSATRSRNRVREPAGDLTWAKFRADIRGHAAKLLA